MTTFREITNSRDWTFGKGRGGYLTREKAVAANIKTSLLFFLNDCFFAMTTGIDWWNLLGMKNPAAQNNIILQVRQTIAQCEGVVRINSVTATTNSSTRRVTITYDVDTVFSRSISGSVSTP